MKIVCLLFHSMGWSTPILGKIRDLSSCQYCYEYDSKRNFLPVIFSNPCFFPAIISKSDSFPAIISENHKRIQRTEVEYQNLAPLFHFLGYQSSMLPKNLVMPEMTSCFLHNYFRYTEYHEMEPAKKLEAYNICPVKISAKWDQLNYGRIREPVSFQ